jgi:3-oxoacyl-[acyl-carrier protein] reductase
MANYLVMTGGSSGIGEKAIALFIERGWRAINISRSPCQVAGVINFSIDLASQNWSEQYQADLQAVVGDAEKICLVHNAASFKSDAVTTLTDESFRDVLNINLVAPVALNRIFLPYMKPGSSIIYIGSTLSEQAVPGRASYVVTKHALVGLMRSTCQDLVGKSIHTACICPGFVNTKMVSDNVTDMAAFRQFIQSKVTANRLIEPDEIANFIYFCAEQPIINGSVLHANLGQIAS